MCLPHNRCHYYSGGKGNNGFKRLIEGLTSKGVSDSIMHVNNAPQLQTIVLIFLSCGKISPVEIQEKAM